MLSADTVLMVLFVLAATTSGVACFLGQYGGTANAVLLGVMIGAMMCVGLGGPINKAAYTFAVDLLTTSRWLWRWLAVLKPKQPVVVETEQAVIA